MNILVITKLYEEFNKSGGERYLHTFLKYFQGAQVYKKTNAKINLKVLIPDSEKMRRVDYKGIELNYTTEKFGDKFLGYIDKCDLVITHLDLAFETVNYCLKIKKPVVMLFHNCIEQYNPFIENENVVKVFNSNFVKHAYMNRGLVPKNFYLIYPHLDYELHWKYQRFVTDADETGRNYITFVNPSENKGAKIVLELAKYNFDKKFLIVEGGYYPHHQRHYLDEFHKLPNCHVIKNTDNMIRDVYSRTHIVLMPSDYESYGLVAAEASAMGIPVVINRESKGLVENMGKLCLGGIGDNVESYQKVLDSLDSPQNYLIWSDHYNSQSVFREEEIESQFCRFLTTFTEACKLRVNP